MPRNSNIEAARIYAMFFITLGHLGAPAVQHGSAWPAWLNIATTMPGIGAVDLFVIITGYFLISRTEFTIARWIKICAQTIFYAVAVTLIFVLLGKAPAHDLLSACYPLGPTKFNCWFVSQYLALILFQPFLSRFAAGLTRRQYQLLLLVLLVTGTTLTPVFPWGYLYSSGWKVWWFVCLFFIGGYIRLHTGNSTGRARIWFAAAIILSAIWTLIAQLQVPGISLTYNSVLTTAVAVAVFMLACRLPMHHNRAINMIASVTFAVYLIHQNCYMLGALHSWITSYTVATPLIAWLHSLMWTLVVFAIALPADLFRQWLFKVAGIDRLCERISGRLSAIMR